jgi:hypothetical protein
MEMPIGLKPIEESYLDLMRAYFLFLNYFYKSPDMSHRKYSGLYEIYNKIRKYRLQLALPMAKSRIVNNLDRIITYLKF